MPMLMKVYETSEPLDYFSALKGPSYRAVYGQRMAVLFWIGAPRLDVWLSSCADGLFYKFTDNYQTLKTKFHLI